MDRVPSWTTVFNAVTRIVNLWTTIGGRQASVEEWNREGTNHLE